MKTKSLLFILFSFFSLSLPAQDYSESIKTVDGEKMVGAVPYGSSGCAVMLQGDNIKVHIFTSGMRTHSETKIETLLDMGSQIATGPGCPYVYVMNPVWGSGDKIGEFSWKLFRLDSNGTKIKVGSFKGNGHPFFQSNGCFATPTAFYYVFWDTKEISGQKVTRFTVFRAAHDGENIVKKTIDIESGKYGRATFIGMKDEKLLFSNTVLVGSEMTTTVYSYTGDDGELESKFSIKNTYTKDISPIHSLREMFGGFYRDNNWQYNTFQRTDIPEPLAGTLIKIIPDPYGEGFYSFIVQQKPTGIMAGSECTGYSLRSYDVEGNELWEKKFTMPIAMADNKTFQKKTGGHDRVVKIFPLDSNSLRIVFYDAQSAHALLVNKGKAGKAGTEEVNIKRMHFATYEQMDQLLNNYLAPDDLSEAREYFGSVRENTIGNNWLLNGLCYGSESHGFVLFDDKNETVEIKIYGNGFAQQPFK